MLGIKGKVLLWLGIALVAFLCLWWGISQYGKKAVVEDRLDAVTELVRNAQATRQEHLKADTQTRRKRAVALESVRTSGIPVEVYIEKTHPADSDPEFERMFNAEIAAANRAISAARGVPE